MSPSPACSSKVSLSESTESFTSYIALRLRQNFELPLLVLMASILYFAFLSRSFDEWDAFNFALALSRYDVSAHQPHPPGYPVFIFISSIVYRITQNPLFSLTSVSALSGGLTLIPTYAIAKRLFNRETALFSALVLMVAPGFWLASEQAVSDMLFTFLLTLAISMLLTWRHSRLRLRASWGMLGVALGLRTFNFVFIAPFFVEAIRAGKRETFYCFMVLSATVLLGLVPAILLTGYDSYVKALLVQWTGHLKTDVITAKPLGLSEADRLGFLLLTLVTRALGGNLPFRILPFFPFTSGSFASHVNFVIIIFLVGIGVLLLRQTKDFEKAFFVILWVVPYFVLVYLLGTPEYSRYLLPILPPLVIVLVASGLYTIRLASFSAISSLVVRRYLRLIAKYWLIAVLASSMFAYSLPLATIIHTEPAPNVQLVNFVRSSYDPLATSIVTFHEFRAFQFYGGEFRYIHCCRDVQKTLGIIESHSHSTDPVLITSSALKALQTKGIMLRVLKVAEFFRSPFVKIEDHRVILYLVLPSAR